MTPYYSFAPQGRSWVNRAMIKAVASDFWSRVVWTRNHLPECNLLPHFGYKIGYCAIQNLFYGLKKCKSSEDSGGRPLQTFKLERTRPLCPPPRFRRQSNSVWKEARGNQRCQFVKTVAVAEAWSLATNFVWGLAKLCSLKTTTPKIHVYPRNLVTLFWKKKQK